MISIHCPACEDSPPDETSICHLALPPRRETGILERNAWYPGCNPQTRKRLTAPTQCFPLLNTRVSSAASSVLLSSTLLFLSFISSFLFLSFSMSTSSSDRLPHTAWAVGLGSVCLHSQEAALSYARIPLTSLFPVSSTQSGFVSLAMASVVPWVCFSLHYFFLFNQILVTGFTLLCSFSI